MCLSILNEDKPLREINSTLIALIDKTKRAEGVADFRLISLCNVVYKLVSRCLANRLKTNMECFISNTQEAFVGNREIYDNSMVGFEGLFTIKKGRFRNGNVMSLKLDILKALTVWNGGLIVLEVMSKLGYIELWIKKLKSTLHSVYFLFF